MDTNLKGKKLLILGAYKSEIEIVRCAQALGIYTIVTDNHLNKDEAPAKYVADEYWDISWSDIDMLSEKCKAERVDGVMAGFSEKRVENASKLCAVIGKPFYTDGVNLDTILNKAGFKKACVESGVEVARHFDEDGDIQYPVIVKPTDNGGSRGISICYNADELKEGILKAKAQSDSGVVEIEEYIVADEVMIYYVVHNGIATLSAMCDRYMHSFDARITQLPVGYRFPSKHLPLLLDKHDSAFKRLIKNLNITNGLIAFQSFVKDDRIIPFDPTYRLDGTMTYHMTAAQNNTNVLEMLIRHSLTGSMGDDTLISKLECAQFKQIGFELPILLGKGTIEKIDGVKEIENEANIIYVYQAHQVGETMSSIADFSQIFCRIQVLADNNDDLERKLNRIFENITVKDIQGNNMIIYREPWALAHDKVQR